jgi:hypothetical protein
VAEQQKIRILSAAERASEARRLVMPDPGDVITAMVFGWAMFCVMLFSGGTRMLQQVARLAKAGSVREIILNIDAATLIFVIILGALIIIALVVFCYSYRKTAFALLIFGASFSNASWKPLHDVAFIFKNFAVVFFAGYAGVFLLKNFWRMVSEPYVRVMLAYFLWVAAVCLLVGGRPGDFWYMVTDLALLIGLGAGWWNYLEDTDQLYEFNMTLVWVAVPIILISATAPVLAENYIESGRFNAFHNLATGFGTTFSPLLLCVFWKAMEEKGAVQRNFFTVVAMLGLVLLLWSGTRSGIIGLMIGIFVMWRVFKTKIFIYFISLATLGLIALIIGGTVTESVSGNFNRLDVTENIGRLELWAEQMEVLVASPVYGHSPTGRGRFGVSKAFQELREFYGGQGDAFSVHNSYLGMAVKFGIVGLVLLISLMAKPMLRARKVVFSDKVPLEERAVFSLPAALSVLIAFEILFEDSLSSEGKGTVQGIIFFSAIFLLNKIGKKLEQEHMGRAVHPSRHDDLSRSKLAGSGNP